MEQSVPTLQEIAVLTKISPRYLRAIENGRFEELPGGIIGRSYIRQYAEAARRSTDDLLSLYLAERHDDTEEVRPETGRLRTFCGSLMRLLTSRREPARPCCLASKVPTQG